VLDLGAGYRLSDRWTVGVAVANALDDAHYEVFGGDLLRRRALAHLTVSW
jgi:outer membrane receptor protein involved in Fe transport